MEFILALKAESETSRSQVRAAVRGFGPSKRPPRFWLVELPRSKFASLRLTHLDAVLVARDDYNNPEPELAEILAWAKDWRRRHPGNPVPMGVVTTAQPNPSCPIVDIAREDKNNLNNYSGCLARLFFILTGRASSPREPDAQSDKLLLEFFVQAFELNWTAPDHDPNLAPPFEGTLRDRTNLWIRRHPRVARASVADAVGWIAYRKAASGTELGVPPGIVTPQNAEDVIVRALSWAIEDSRIGKERQRALVANPSNKVAVLWTGDDLEFRLALMGMLIRQIGWERVPATSRTDDDFGLPDLAKGLGPVPSLPSDKADKAPIMVCTTREQVEASFVGSSDFVALSVAPRDVDHAKRVARDHAFDCIEMQEEDFELPLDTVMANARQFTTHTS